MANFITNDIKSVFRTNNRMGQIIVLNVVVFIFLNIVKATYGFGPEGELFYKEFLPWFGIPTKGIDVLFHFWTLFTYMFSHVAFFHILWNMLLLYWFGRILQDLLGQEKLLYAYLGGGLAGGVLFAVFTFFPGLFSGSSALIGASGGVLSVVVAAATLTPNFQISLILIGPVKIKYLALFIFITSTVLDFNLNTGGKLAHVGGALFGFLYINQLQNGTNLAAPLEQIAAFFNRRKQTRSHMRVVHKNTQNKGPQTSNSADLEKRVDEILDKINSSGYDSLSKSERELLFRASKRND